MLPHTELLKLKRWNTPTIYNGWEQITERDAAHECFNLEESKDFDQKFSRYEDASAALPRIQSLGYEDAFIVAWYNGIQVTTQKAKQLE